LKQYKICVYAICKDELSFADSWVASMSEADIIVVTDTGSTDGTAERLRELGVVVHRNKINPWRFDVARNLSLNHVPHDVDICVCTDLDERFRPGWRKKLEEAWDPEAKTARYLYNWSQKADGSPDVQFNYFKAHSRFDYKWVYPVHECLKYVGNQPEKIVFAKGMVLDHYPDAEKSRSSYLPLLEQAAKEFPEDDRVVYYLGREYMYRSMWEKCIETLQQHLKLNSAVWKEERCASMRWIAKSCYALHNNTEAYRWYFRSIAECDYMREPYIEFAKLAYTLNDWETVFYLTSRALRISEKSESYVNMGYCWDHTPDDLAALSCYRLGMYEKALHHAKKALSYQPDDLRLQENLVIIAAACNPTSETEQEKHD